jgi:S-DNA-T family DNA segregation ATPase FtsK/SpoIIIE
MSDLTTLMEVGGSLAAVGGGAAYLRAEQPAAYWSMVGLPLSTARLLGSYTSVMDACGLTVPPSRLRALAVRATTRREVRPVRPGGASSARPRRACASGCGSPRARNPPT